MEWRPFPRQEEALKRTEFEILYGGARGGGKTDAGLVWLTDEIDNPRYRALVIRRNADDLIDWVDRAVRFYSGLGAKIAYRPAEITFPSGAIIRTGHLKDDQAYTKYMGQEFHRIVVEELTQIPEEKRYLQLLASCRSTTPKLRPHVFCTTNPGNVGHAWVKKRFIDPSPPGIPFVDKTTGRSRIYIPATVDDNTVLSDIDPEYVHFLDGLKDTDLELWKAWRLGDWSSFAGMFFREWKQDIHICSPFIPRMNDNKTIVAGLDWGRVDTFVCLFDVVEKIEEADTSYYRCKTFLEVTGTEKTPKEWGQLIKKRLGDFGLTLDNVAWIRCDNQIYNLGNDMSKSIYDQFIDEDERYRTLLKPASKERIGGWENLHNWLSLAPDGLPYWQIASNCPDTIESLTTLVHDENKVEDVAPGNDHAADACRYEKKHLKWIDARVGGVMSDKQPERNLRPAVQMEDGRQVSIDLDRFANIGNDNTRVITRVR